MRVFKISFMMLLFVSILTVTVASASNYVQFNAISIPNGSSSTGYEYGTLEKSTNSSQYLHNTNNYNVKAKIYGLGTNGNYDWSPTWNTVSKNSWGELGSIGNGTANPNQYGLYASNSNKIRIKTANILLGNTFWGMWVTDQNLYEMMQ